MTRVAHELLILLVVQFLNYCVIMSCAKESDDVNRHYIYALYKNTQKLVGTSIQPKVIQS